LAWTSAKGKGNTDETLRQSELVAQGELAIKAVDGLKIDIRQVNQNTVSQTIDAMVQADPSLAWIKQMELRGDVDWREVKELHDSFKYSNSGLGAGAQIVIAIIVTYFTMGAASGAIAAAGTGTSMAGATAAATATSAAGWANAAGSVVLAGMASNGAISTINNRGNLGAVFKDVTSSDAMRGYVVSGVTAGLTAGFYDDWTSTQTGTTTALPNSGVVTSASPLSTWQGVGQFTANQVLQNGTSAILTKALGGEASLGDALQSSLANAFAAYGFNMIGDVSKNRFADGGITKIGLHALMGGLAAEAAGGDFRTGALAAGVNEALVDSLAKQYASMPEDKRKGLLVMSSQLIGVLAASVDSDADGESLQTGAWVASNATQYNFLNHSDVIELEAAEKDCHPNGTCDQVKKEFDARSAANLARLDNCEATHNCAQIRAELDEGSKAIVASVERTETLNPGGSSNDLVASYRTVNEQEWTKAGQLHLNQIANLWVNGDPTWMKEGSLYLDQTGFNPFGINVVPGMLPGGGAGSVGAAGVKPTINPGHEAMAETGKPRWDTPQSRVDGEFGPTNGNHADTPKVKVEDSNYPSPIVNPATNKIVTEHIVAPSGKAPKTANPNSIYEISRADGSKSVTYYDDLGRTFSREDYGQQRSHGSLGYATDGRAVPHEHKIEYNDRGFVDKQYYREVSADGKVVGPWILDK
jgi:filamentous hemagglutinin